MTPTAPTPTLTATLLERIRKLMALSTNNPSEAEASLAASRIQDLLQQHNLSMAEVEQHSASSDAAARTAADVEATGGPRTRTAHNKSAMYQYQRTLMEAVATNAFCMHFVNEARKDDPRGRYIRVDQTTGTMVKFRRVKVHYLIGRAVNVQVAQMTYDYLVETMDRLLPYTGMEKRGKSALLWLAGCTDRLVERLAELRAKRERENENARAAAGMGDTGTGTSLIRLSDLYSSEEELNHDVRHGYPLGTTARRRREAEAEEAAAKIETARLIREGMDKDTAWYEARGMTPPNWRLGGDVETDAQRRKREACEARENAQWHARTDREWERKQAKTRSPEYKNGARSADGIGLDAQVGKSHTKEIKG